MANEKSINKDQLKRLQVLYAQLARHTDQGADRDSRLAWASQLVERPIGSFSDLTRDEAGRLIDTLQGQLGVKTPPRRRLSREAAHRAGTEGRRNNPYKNSPQIASAADLEVITEYYMRLGWTRAQFDAWLSSSRSPIRRAQPKIVTLADANAVRWALKRMLQRAGLWEDRAA